MGSWTDAGQDSRAAQEDAAGRCEQGDAHQTTGTRAALAPRGVASCAHLRRGIHSRPHTVEVHHSEAAAHSSPDARPPGGEKDQHLLRGRHEGVGVGGGLQQGPSGGCNKQPGLRENARWVASAVGSPACLGCMRRPRHKPPFAGRRMRTAGRGRSGGGTAPAGRRSPRPASDR